MSDMEQDPIWNLQMAMLYFVCKIIKAQNWQPYWDEIATIETTAQAKEFLTNHGWLEKYNEYKKEQNKK